MAETLEMQDRDSALIFKAISNSGASNYEEAQEMVVSLYVPDMSISRSGISRALQMLKGFYSEEPDETV